MEKPWSCIQLPGPHWRDHGADLPFPALPLLSPRTPSYFNRTGLTLFTKNSASAASVITVLSTFHGLAAQFLLHWNEITGKLPEKLLGLCRWNTAFTSTNTKSETKAVWPTILPLGQVAVLLHWEQQTFILMMNHPRLRLGDKSASGLVLQPTRAEWIARLRAALLVLWGRDDVPQGLLGQWPKQMPEDDDQLASTLTWKGLWIWGCCSNVVFSVVSVIIYTCSVWFVYIPHQFLQIPFPRPTWQYTGISQQW